jgi:long-chain acyl-CoA synthetase
MTKAQPSTRGFVESLVATAAQQPDRCAMDLLDGPQSGRDRWTYGDLLQLAARYRRKLTGMGLQPGAGVMLQLPSGPDLAAAVFACASARLVFCPLNTGLTQHEFSLLAEDFKPAAILTTAAGRAQGSYPADAQIVAVDTELDGDPDSSDLSLPPPEGNPVVSCHYTYKGLGRPLGVEHRYHDYTSCMTAMASAYPGVRDGSHFVGLPVYAVYGLTAALLGPLFMTGRIVLTHKSFEIDPVEVLENHRIRFACVVPFLLRRFISKAKRRVESGRPLRLHPDLEIVCGGSYMPPELADEARQALGIEVYQGYGTTETLPVAGTAPGRMARGSIGVPFASDIEIAIFGPDWREKPAEVGGSIAVRGPSVITQFRGAPEGSERFFHDGWFNTGDLGYKDADGNLHFLGRASAFTKVASQMVDLVEVESVLRLHPGVADARVTVRKRADVGEVLAASVIPVGDASPTERELKAHCKKLISSHKVPRDIKLCPQR